VFSLFFGIFLKKTKSPEKKSSCRGLRRRKGPFWGTTPKMGEGGLLKATLKDKRGLGYFSCGCSHHRKKRTQPRRKGTSPSL